MFKLIKVPYQAPTTVKTILSNFSTNIPLNPGHLIDIDQALDFLEQNKQKVSQLCIENNTNYIALKNINHRLYITLAIQKQHIPFFS